MQAHEGAGRKTPGGKRGQHRSELEIWDATVKGGGKQTLGLLFGQGSLGSGGLGKLANQVCKVQRGAISRSCRADRVRLAFATAVPLFFLHVDNRLQNDPGGYRGVSPYPGARSAPSASLWCGSRVQITPGAESLGPNH
jgi:hypothetical protein